MENPGKIFASNDMNKCRHCGEYSFQISGHRVNWSAKCYRSYLSVPFEYLNLKIPEGYDEVLTVQYGDWRTPSKSGGYHDELILEPEKPYKDVLVERFGYKPEWVRDLP